MPQELPPLPLGDVAEYKRARNGSGLSDEELLEEQAGVERRIAKKAALRGVTLIGAAVVKQRNASLRASAASAASVSADASLRERAAAVSARCRCFFNCSARHQSPSPNPVTITETSHRHAAAVRR